MNSVQHSPLPTLHSALELARRSRESGCESLSDADLEELLHSAASTLSEEPTSGRVADALGAVDVAVRRRLGFSPTEQQLAAAALLLRGVVVEMDAGEGKTLASGMAAAVYAAAGRSVHVLTANDYLAARDCDTLAPALESLGLTVGLVIDGMDRQERRFQYAAQIVFTTAREVGFDYLRDSVAESFDRRVNPIFDVAIVDEADHQLIDQARTPLIISGDRIPEPVLGADLEELAVELMERQAAYVDDLYARVASGSNDLSQTLAAILLAGGLTPRLVSELDRLGVSTRQVFSDVSRFNDEDEDHPLETDLLFAIDPVSRYGAGPDRSTLRLTERGWDEVYAKSEASPVSAFGTVQALRARVLHDAGADYVLDQDGITLVDRLDGRPMFSHRYMHGLHEALESKEGLDRHSRADAKARTSIRALMSNYQTVAGLTGTAMEAAGTFAREYGVETVRVPPEVESRRVDLGTEVFFDRDEHIAWVVDEVTHWHSLGRPVLVTTGSVQESATFSAVLTERSIPHRLLNAENPEAESEIVAAGGEFGAVTVSTGMAGRGTDFIASHNLGLMVIITSLPASVRVERQIMGRTGRQGSFGATKIAVYINDPALAFSRRQGDIAKLKHGSPAEGTVEGAEVGRILRQVQTDAETQSELIARAMSEFEAVVESESRAHYAARVDMMESHQSPTLPSRMISDWVTRRTMELDDHRTDYGTRFAVVSDSLWHHYGIDVGTSADVTPSEVRRELEMEAHERLSLHRDRLGAKRFVLAVAECRLSAADELWPARLAEIQEMALTFALGVSSRHAAVTELAEQVVSTRTDFWAVVEDEAIRTMLNSGNIADRGRMGDNHIERLPDELEALLR